MAKKKVAKKKPARAKARTAARKDLPARAKASKGTVTDEVVVAFVHGDIRAPVVTGHLWNSNDRPPT
jgi:type VI secretion system (T6SS) baseplate-like injector VgrG